MLLTLQLTGMWFFFGDGVAKSLLLAMMPGAIAAREVCDFLATLASYSLPWIRSYLMSVSNIIASFCGRGAGMLGSECSFRSLCGFLCSLKWVGPCCSCPY
jgi:hypothetical protein